MLTVDDIPEPYITMLRNNNTGKVPKHWFRVWQDAQDKIREQEEAEMRSKQREFIANKRREQNGQR